MMGLDFSGCEFVVCDPQEQTRGIVRSALWRIGAKRIREFDSIAHLTAGLEGTSPDVLFVHADEEDASTFKLISRLRAGEGIDNPFLTIVVTSWIATSNLFIRVRNAGADDLMIKPFPLRLVEDRLLASVNGRPNFLVTSDYIGPDRRRGTRTGQAANVVLEVPNTLRLKALDRVPGEAVTTGIEMALSEVRRRRRKAQAFQILFLAEFCAPGLLEGEEQALLHLRLVPQLATGLLEAMQRDGKGERVEASVRLLIAQCLRFETPAGRVRPAVAELKATAGTLLALCDPDADFAEAHGRARQASDAYRLRRLERDRQLRASA